MEHLALQMQKQNKNTTTLFLEVADILNITGGYNIDYRSDLWILFSSVKLNFKSISYKYNIVFQQSYFSWSTHTITFRYQNAFIDKLQDTINSPPESI